VYVYALPAGTVTASIPYQYDGSPQPPRYITLSGSGTILGQFLDNALAGGCGWQTTPVAGGATGSGAISRKLGGHCRSFEHVRSGR
jgi:hypothetical protein